MEDQTQIPEIHSAPPPPPALSAFEHQLDIENYHKSSYWFDRSFEASMLEQYAITKSHRARISALDFKVLMAARRELRYEANRCWSQARSAQGGLFS